MTIDIVDQGVKTMIERRRNMELKSLKIYISKDREEH